MNPDRDGEHTSGVPVKHWSVGKPFLGPALKVEGPGSLPLAESAMALNKIKV